MPRYIDADFCKMIGGTCIAVRLTSTGEIFPIVGLDEVPCADVRENVHGWWIDDYDPVNFGEFRYKCSECGARTVEWADNFCYHCGADMRGEQNENN